MPVNFLRVASNFSAVPTSAAYFASAAFTRSSAFAIIGSTPDPARFDRVRSARERKRRTRRLILIGSYMDHVTQTDPDRKARLMKGLDGFLERERDRELFGLAPKQGEL